MKLKSMLLAVRDLQASVAFYKEVFGLRVVADFGANVTLTGGLSLQTLDTWEAFIGKEQVVFGGNDAEVYFEEDDFEAFLKKLEGAEVRYVHPPLEQSWGQRTVRLYDPDGHVLEIGENMRAVCRRFVQQGMSAEQIAVRMDIPVKDVRALLR